MSFIKWIAAILIALYFLSATAVYSLQGHLIYQPPPRVLQECTLPTGVEQWRGGIEQGLFSPSEGNNLVVFFHGNAESACNWRYLGVNHINPLGYDVLAFEYPGYGGDPRTPSKREIGGALGEVNAWVEAADYDRVVVMGYSLGTGVASLYAEEFGADKLMLFAPYDSIYNVAIGQGLVFPRFLLRENFDNVAALSGLDTPVTILHGLEDTVIPAHHSENLFQMLEAEGLDVRRDTLEGVGHQGLFDSPAFDRYIATYMH